MIGFEAWASIRRHVIDQETVGVGDLEDWAKTLDDYFDSEVIGYLVALPGIPDGVFTPDWDGEIHQHQGKAEQSLRDAKSDGFDDAVLTALVRLPDPADLEDAS